MPGALKEIRTRIKSVKNTKKITKAMELVSASKMRRAVQNALSTRPYASLAWQILLDLLEKTDPRSHVLLRKDERSESVAMLIIGSNRGLCGAFNTKIFEKTISLMEQEYVRKTIECITYGKKVRDMLLREKRKVVADFPKPDVLTSMVEVLPMSEMLISKYRERVYDKVILIYTDFVSAGKQRVRVKQLLPFDAAAEEMFGDILAKSSAGSIFTGDTYHREFRFEPSASSVLDALIPRLIEMQVYQAVLESDASEHSARMLTMKNATDAASDMLKGLTLDLNSARQAAITQEIAEISSGKLALEAAY
ncbi:MAG: ATP synthase F1 subunit gamma [Parcubacteria group bacterium]|nr:ATP synthase F1 subunit gamma [Parcubacteria group bacterium]